MLENSTVVNSPTVFYFECVYSSIMPNYVEKLWANVCFFYYSLLMTNELWWVWSFLNLYKEISSAQVFLTKGIEIFRSCQILKIILTVPSIFILFSIGRLSIVWKQIVCSFFFFLLALWSGSWMFVGVLTVTSLQQFCLVYINLTSNIHKTLKLKMLLFKNQFLGIFIAFNIMLFVWMLKWELKPKLLKPEFMIDILYFEYCCGHFSILFWLL